MSLPLLIMAISLSAFAFTMLGGFLALSLKDRLHLVLGFSAGAVIGVAFFDLLPEALAASGTLGTRPVLLFAALGFFSYTVIDRLIAMHQHGHEHERSAPRGWVGAGSFSAHSVLDGFAIGIAFQDSRAIGLVVAIAVLVHDFSDGLNTVNVIVKNGGTRHIALRWLILDAVAPIIGAALSLFVHVQETGLAVILAIFSGFFLYIGASDLLPESHHAHPRFLTTLTTLLGAGALLFATQFAG